VIERLAILVIGALIGAALGLGPLRSKQAELTKLPAGSCAQQVAECVRLDGDPEISLGLTGERKREFTCTKTVKVMP
jgi:hypothetical protein